MNKLVLIFLLSSICISCSSVEQEKAEAQSKESLEEKDKKAQKTNSDVAVTSSQGKQSKPLSDSAGNAEQNKNDETYIVPNKEFSPKDEKQKDKKEKKNPPTF